MTPRHIKYKYGLLAAFLIIVVGTIVGGCSSGMEPSPDDSPNGGNVILSFKIQNIGGDGMTRAASDVLHPDEAGSVDENFIDCDGELQLLLFDSSDMLMKVFTKDEFVVTPENPQTNDYTLYKLTTTINKGYFNFADGKDEAEFSLMLIANMDGIKDGQSWDSMIPYSFASSTAQVSSQLRGFDYTGCETVMNGIQYPWSPSQYNKRLIPMSGKKKFRITKKSFESDEEILLDDQMEMLRALAKIRLIDNLKSDLEPNAQISDAWIVGFNGKATYLPLISGTTNSDWIYDGTQITETPTTNKGEWFSSDGEYPMEKGTLYGDTPEATSIFYAYIPEYALTDGAMKLRIRYCVDLKTEHFPEKEVSWNLKINRNIVRNHIYEITVTKKPEQNAPEKDVELKVSYMVCPWSKYDTEIPPFN